MTEQTDTVEQKVGRCMLNNWAEERAVAALDSKVNRLQIQRQGHKGILTWDADTKMETVTSHRTDFIPPKGPGVRERGIRSELLEKQIALMIREKFQAEQNSAPPEIDFYSTTQRDFSAEGFVPLTPELSHAHNYKSEEAVTFWSENRHQIHGVTAVQTQEAPFRKSTKFSTPISERLDEPELPPDN